MKFLCLLWQHCRRPWSFTCEPCSFDSGRTGFVWVRRVWNVSADPKSGKCEVHSVTRFLKAKCERTGRRWVSGIYCDYRWNMVVSPHSWIQATVTASSTTMMRCKKNSWRGWNGRRQTSMTRGYRSRFQDLINVWTMPATVLKNKVMYRHFIHSVAFVN